MSGNTNKPIEERKKQKQNINPVNDKTLLVYCVIVVQCKKLMVTLSKRDSLSRFAIWVWAWAADAGYVTLGYVGQLV